MQLFDRRVLDVSITIQGIANEPAENPAVGTQYIVGATPTGAFASATANKIARFDGTKWRFTKPKAGRLEVINLETNEILKYTGVEWSRVAELGSSGGITIIKGFAKTIADISSITFSLQDYYSSFEKFYYVTEDSELYGRYWTGESAWGTYVIKETQDCYCAEYDESSLGADYLTSKMVLPFGTCIASSTAGKLYTLTQNGVVVSNISENAILFNEYNSALYIFKNGMLSLLEPKVYTVKDIIKFQNDGGSTLFADTSGSTVPSVGDKIYICNTGVESITSLEPADGKYSIETTPIANSALTHGERYAIVFNGDTEVHLTVVGTDYDNDYPDFINIIQGDFVFNLADGCLYTANSARTAFVKVGGESASAEFKPNAPVIAIVPTGTTLPATATTGDKFLKTDDAKLYTATAADTWNAGVLTANGDRYASSTDFKIYQSDGSTLTAEDVPTGGLFLNKSDNYIYVYDTTFVRASVDNAKIVETHTLTAAEATAKSFTLNNSIKTGEETNIMLFVGGAPQVPGTDFTALGNAISWNEKGLDDIGLVEDDVFIIHYVKG